MAKTLSRLAPVAEARIRQGMPGLLRQRRQAILVDRWTTGTQQLITDLDEYGSNQGRPFVPRNQAGVAASGDQGAAEFEDTASKASAPFGKLVVSSLAQTIYLEGARIRGQSAEVQMDAFKVLRRNNWSRQGQAHTRATVAHGISFVCALPGKDPLTGKDFPRVRAYSAKRVAVYFDDETDEWGEYAIRLGPGLVDDEGNALRQVYYLDSECELQFTMHGFDINSGEDFPEDVRLSFDGVTNEHDLGVCPMVPYYNLVDLEGNPTGEVTPIIPTLRRIDQDTFDRLVVQRFGAWKIRYIAGMAKPTTAAQERAQRLALTAADILIAEDKDTKFGTLDGTDTAGYIAATDHDLRVLAAVSQTPPHHLLGLSSNLQAEALAASEAGLQRKSLDYRLTNAGSHEKLLRLIARIRENEEEAHADEIEIVWRDDNTLVLEQTARALGTLADSLGIPTELLWHRIPNWTEADSERAKQLVEDERMNKMMEVLAAAAGKQEQGSASVKTEPKEPANDKPID